VPQTSALSSEEKQHWPPGDTSPVLLGATTTTGGPHQEPRQKYSQPTGPLLHQLPAASFVHCPQSFVKQQ